MKTRKNIDRLYHERLKDLETTPRHEVWKNIAAHLPKKQKKKRIIPLWFKIAGAAAVLALLFSVSNTVFGPSKSENIYPSTSFSYAASEIKENIIKSDPVSTDFKENMYRTAILLESLIKNTQSEKGKLIKEAKTPGKTKKTTTGNNTLFADIIKIPAEVVFNNPNYTFNDYNTVAFAKEERQKEKKEENTAEKELEDLTLLASEEEDEESAEETRQLSLPSKRLSVSTTTAAVYFDNLGTGNTINSQFGNNKSSGEISVAYGINFAYQISGKVKIRSGIIKVDLSHNTQDVDYVSAVSALAGNSPGGQMNGETANLISSRIPGELKQQMGFIEVPVEIEYALIDKKIGLYLIGGASTLFLNDNMVILKSFESSNSLGEAHNLNNISFSTNIGMGIDYNISPRFQWNLEPIFKYQLNTFSNTPGVKPYNFGIYSGFSFKF